MAINRQPVGIAAVRDTDHVQGFTVVICDDGSAWFMSKGAWEEYPPIPGTDHAAVLGAGTTEGGTDNE